MENSNIYYIFANKPKPMQDMKKTYLFLTISMIVVACSNKSTQAESSTAGADSTLANQDSITVVEAPNEDDQAFNQFFDQLNFGDFVELLKSQTDENAKKCGLSLIYHAYDPGDGDADMSADVFGWGIEKGKKLDFGYELKTTSPHACYFYYQADTSRQAAMCFKNKADAERFMEKALAYGLVEMDGTYHVNEEKLPNGTVKVNSFSDYRILTSMEKLEYDEEYHKGFYVIRFYYFA